MGSGLAFVSYGLMMLWPILTLTQNPSFDQSHQVTIQIKFDFKLRLDVWSGRKIMGPDWKIDASPVQAWCHGPLELVSRSQTSKIRSLFLFALDDV